MYDAYIDDEPEAASEINERERFRSVLSAPEYKGRERAAHQMLFESEMDAVAIVGVLGTLPAASKEARVNDGRGPLGISIIGSVASKAGHTINAAEIYRARRQTIISVGPVEATPGNFDVYANRRRAVGS